MKKLIELRGHLSIMYFYDDFINEENLIVVCKKCHKEIHYKDNPDLIQFKLERATTIEN